MSDSFVSLLPESERLVVRKVDEIYLGTKDDGEILGLYCHDFLDLYRKVLDEKGKVPSDLKLRWKDENTSQYGIRSVDRVANFLQRYEVGVSLYLDGRWDLALKSLEKALEMHPKDGPSKVGRRGAGYQRWLRLTQICTHLQAIVRFIKEHGEPPPEWTQRRALH